MDFFRNLFGSKSSSSAKVAKDRLILVLSHDRTDISPQLMENLRKEIVSVLAKYMEIDESSININLDKDDRKTSLVANIPVVRIKRGGRSAE
ncbi:cell division topological specificity factor [Synergistales bacterium]|nr:cell division topological specificity factor [Synergistales bacterium]